MKHTIEDIVDLCKCEVTLEVDSYKNKYLSFTEGLSDAKDDWDLPYYVIEEMYYHGRIISLQCYPKTPVGFQLVFGGTVQSVINRMYDLLTGENNDRS